MRLEGPDVHAFAQRLKEKDQGPFLKKFEENLDDISDGEVQASIDQELFREKQQWTSLLLLRQDSTTTLIQKVVIANSSFTLPTPWVTLNRLGQTRY